MARFIAHTHDNLIGQHFRARNHTRAISIGFTQYRRRFTRHRRLINGGKAAHNLTIGGYNLARFDQYQILFFK